MLTAVNHDPFPQGHLCPIHKTKARRKFSIIGANHFFHFGRTPTSLRRRVPKLVWEGEGWGWGRPSRWRVVWLRGPIHQAKSTPPPYRRKGRSQKQVSYAKHRVSHFKNWQFQPQVAIVQKSSGGCFPNANRDISKARNGSDWDYPPKRVSLY